MLGSDGAEICDRFGPDLRDIGHGSGVFVRIQANKQCAMFFQGAATQFYGCEHINYGSDCG